MRSSANMVSRLPRTGQNTVCASTRGRWENASHRMPSSQFKYEGDSERLASSEVQALGPSARNGNKPLEIRDCLPLPQAIMRKCRMLRMPSLAVGAVCEQCECSQPHGHTGELFLARDPCHSIGSTPSGDHARLHCLQRQCSDAGVQQHVRIDSCVAARSARCDLVLRYSPAAHVQPRHTPHYENF